MANTSMVRVALLVPLALCRVQLSAVFSLFNFMCASSAANLCTPASACRGWMETLHAVQVLVPMAGTRHARPVVDMLCQWV